VLDRLHHETTSADLPPEVRRSLLQRAEPRAKKTSFQINLSDLEIRDPVAAFNEQDWPREDLNFPPTALAEPAGDVNGDGVNDWIYRYQNVADNRSSDLSARTDKTLLVFGGGDVSARYFDELFFGDLQRAGSFLGNDDFADAVEFLDDGLLRVYEGSEGGYEETGVVSLPALRETLRPPVDLDGDGFDDLVITAGNFSPVFTVVFGAASLEDVEVKTYNPSFEGANRFQYTTGNVEGGEQGQIIRLNGASNTPPIVATTFQIDTDREVAAGQSFTPLTAEEVPLPTFADRVNLALFDVNGSGTKELLMQEDQFRGGFDSTFVYSLEQEADPRTPADIFPGDVTGVGDLNDDGRADFAFRDESGAAGIGFGPDSLGGGLEPDLSFAEDAEEVDFSDGDPLSGPRPLGDVTGDGRDDFLVEITLSDQFGPRLLEVAEDGSLMETDGMLFEKAAYSGDELLNSEAIGDWNGDGTDDVALVFNEPEGARVEIYFDDPSASSPDLTLTHDTPFRLSEASIATGDFTDNGSPNLAVGWASNANTVEIFEAGEGEAPIHSIAVTDLGIPEDAGGFTDEFPAQAVLENVGDVNANGTDDLAVTVPIANAPEAKAAFLFLEPSLSQTPDVTIDYSGDDQTSRFVGTPIQALGDINDDGLDDFAVGDISRTVEPDQGFASGGLFVHFGQDAPTPSFDAPDVTIEPEPGEQFELLSAFPLGTAVADVTNNGHPDLVAKPAFFQNAQSGEGTDALFVYEGGSGFDGTADASVKLPGFLDPSSTGGFATQNLSEVTALPPAPSDSVPRVMVGTAFGGGGALIHRASDDGSDVLEPTTFLRGPDQSSGLGISQNFLAGPKVSTGVGDYDGDGDPSLILPQVRSLSFRTTPGYEYNLGEGNPPPPDDPVASDSAMVDSSNFGSTVELEETGTAVTLSDNSSGSGEISSDRFDSRPEGSGTIGRENVAEARVELTAGEGLTVGDSTEVRFDVSGIDGVNDPTRVTIVTREIPGVGGFTELETTFDEDENELVAMVDGFSEFAFASNTEPLPVEMAGFEGTVTEGGVRLTWQTASETNNAGFEVQRRAGGEPGAGWQKVGFVESKAAGGTTNEPLRYRFEDEDLSFAADRLTYRLRQVDTDGTESVTDPIEIERTVDRLRLRKTFPNPARGQATVQFTVPERQEVHLELYDVLGRRVRTVVSSTQEGRHEQRLDTSRLSSGVYFLRLRAGGETRTQKLTVVQ